MASFFKQLSDDMEKVVQVVEEGAKFMMGESARMGGEGPNAASPSTAFGDDVHVDPDGDAIFDDMDDMYGSPLMGMADSVMSDIMSMQVCENPSASYIVNNAQPLHHDLRDSKFSLAGFYSGRSANTKRAYSSVRCCDHLE